VNRNIIFEPVMKFCRFWCKDGKLHYVFCLCRTSYSHAMDVEDERKRKKKLKLQKKHNLSVQEKVDSWKDKNSDNRRKC